jgi:hypothetical protein
MLPQQPLAQDEGVLRADGDDQRAAEQRVRQIAPAARTGKCHGKADLEQLQSGPGTGVSGAFVFASARFRAGRPRQPVHRRRRLLHLGPAVGNLVDQIETRIASKKSIGRGNHQVRDMPRLLVEAIQPAREILRRDHHRHAVMDRRDSGSAPPSAPPRCPSRRRRRSYRSPSIRQTRRCRPFGA